MPNLEAQAAWVPVREIGIELAQGGPNGNMNEQAKALLARTEFLNQQKASKFEIMQGHYEFNTYAEFNAIKSTLPLNCTVIINEMPTGTQTWGQGTNRWNGTTLTKSAYDPLTQAKNYTDESSLDSMRRLTQFSEAKDQILAEFIGDGLLGVASNGVGYAVGLDVENNSISYIDFTFGNMQDISSFDFQIFERGMDNYTVMPGSPTDKLIFEKAYTAKEVAQHNIINSSLLYTTVRFDFPALTFTDKKRVVFAVSSDAIFSCKTKGVNPPDTSITDSRGGFYKHATVGWTSFNLGDRRIAYKVGFKSNYLTEHEKVVSIVDEFVRTTSTGIQFYHSSNRDWTCFGKGFSTHTNQQFNRIGMWFANLHQVSKLNFQIFARPDAIASEIRWIGASLKDIQIHNSYIDVAEKYANDETEHLIDFDFDASLVPAAHFVMILVTAEKADGSIATFGSAARTDTSNLNRVDRGVWLINNTGPAFVGIDTTYPYVLSYVQKSNVDSVLKGIKAELKSIELTPSGEVSSTPIFQPILKATSDNLNVDLTGTIIAQADKKTELTASFILDATTVATATKDSTLNKSSAKFWISNPNEFLGFCNISNVVVTNKANNTALTSGVHYEVDSFGGKLIGLTDTVYNVSVSFTHTMQRYDLIQINPFTLAVSVKKGIERTQDPSEWMVEVDQPCRALCRVLVTGTKTEIVPLDEYISSGGKPYVSKPEFDALRLHNQSCLKRIFAKLNKGQNISLVGYGDSITAMGGYHTEDIPNENHDWYGFFATLPQDTQNAKVPTFSYEGGGGGRMHTGWNWKLKEYLERTYSNEVVYWNYGVSGTDSTNGARDQRLAYPLSKNPDLVVVAFGMNDAGSSALYTNLVKIVNAFKNAGADVVLMPVVRTPTLPFVNYQGEAWRQVNRFVYSAAIDTGAAYCPIDWYADDSHYGGMGINFKHFCTQNMFNHPGPYEYSIYSKILVSVFE